MSETTEKRKKPRWTTAQRALAWVLTLLLAVLGVLLFIYRDYLTSDSLAERFGAEVEVAEYEPYVYETGTDQVFASVGGGLAVASSTGLQLLSADGSTVSRQIFSLKTPALAAADRLCAVYDAGGTTLRVVDMVGETVVLDTESSIISVTANAGGWLAVTAEESGYKASVTVYNDRQEAVYRWYSGSDYILSARVSPDCGKLAILCAGAAGSSVRFYSLDATDELCRLTAADELLLDARWLTDERLCAVSEDRMLFFDDSGLETASLDFGDMYLCDYELGGGNFGAVMLSRYLSGSAGVLLTFNGAGEELARLEINRGLVSLSAARDRLLALYADALVLYSGELEILDEREGVLGVRQALLRSSGDALLLTGYDAQVYEFRTGN